MSDSDVRIIAFDPGKTTGWIFVAVRDGSCVPEVVTGEFAELSDAVSLLDALKPNEVVVEEFKIYPWKAVNMSWSSVPSAEVIGVIKLWCSDNCVKLVFQPPSLRTSAPRPWLKGSPLWSATKGKPHARDAARHMLVYLFQNHKKLAEKFFMKKEACCCV